MKRANLELSKNRFLFWLILAVAWAASLPAASMKAAHQKAVPPYLNPALPIPERVDDLVSRMTLKEKVLQMQHTAPAIPRLDVPSYDWWSEALHGVARAGVATMFPQAISMAATWDAPLIYREGRVIATEGRAKYNQAQREGNHSMYFGLDFWAPSINIVRDPRWGRGQETYGEDPFLTGTLATAYVRGMQGNNPRYFELIATPKAFDAYSGPEPLRHSFSANVSPHAFQDTYLPAFRAAIVHGHADSVMCSYNAINGVPSCANPFLLKTMLRQAWHFHGYVTSDCGAVADIAFGHHYAPDLEHASADAVQAGTDTTCGNEYVTLVQAVKDGLVKESVIDRAVKRLFAARMKLGMFDPPSMVPFSRIPMSEVDSPAHRALALRAAREAMVLLKNDGILPLKPGVKTIAVIGPEATLLRALEGNYHGVASHPVLPLDGMEQEFSGKARILYAQGSPLVSELAVPVPRTVFHPAGEPEVEGLKAEYFANPNFSGPPTLVRTDPEIQFDWNAARPARQIPMKAFSVRWTGTFTPPGPGDYTFSIYQPHCYPCGDQESFAIYLGGKKMATGSNFSRQPAPPKFTVHFNRVRPHQFRLDYSHRSPLFGAGVTLEWKPPLDVLRQQAVETAKRADVVVAFVGLSPDLEGEEMPLHIHGFDGGDRTSLRLPPVQRQLLRALASTGKPLVVVLMTGSAVAVNWAARHADAILEAWYPGEAGGEAIADTLAGQNNPGGRLPITFYASLSQLPPFTDYSMQNRTYRYFHGQPLFGFGYGLSYSTFAFSHLKLSSDKIQAGQPLTVTAEVRNTSKIPGDEVAELYIEYPPAPGNPIRALEGFERIRLAAGDARRVSFNLTPRDLSVVNEQGQIFDRAGTYTVFVGGSQPTPGAAGVSATFEIVGRKELPR